MSESFDRVAPHPVEGAVRAVEGGVAELLGASLWSLADRDLLALRRDLERLSARLAAATLAVTREVDGRGAAMTTGAPTTAAWLRAGLHVHPAAAKREVALAGALAGDCAATGAALRGGDVSAAQAETIADAVASLPASVPGGRGARARRSCSSRRGCSARASWPGSVATCCTPSTRD
jgi:hypothetical protein